MHHRQSTGGRRERWENVHERRVQCIIADGGFIKQSRYFCSAFSLVGKHSLLRRTAPHGQPKEALRNHKDGCNCYDSIRTEHPSVNRR